MSTLTTHVAPKNVLDVLGRHMLVDGYHVVLDLERPGALPLRRAPRRRSSSTSSRTSRRCPIGYNHPKLRDPEFREELSRAP